MSRPPAGLHARLGGAERIVTLDRPLARSAPERGSLEAALLRRTDLWLPVSRLPLALARLHGALVEGGRAGIVWRRLSEAASARERARGWARRRELDRGRQGLACDPARARTWLEDAGFDEVESVPGRGRDHFWTLARRAHSLPDYVRPGISVLICGLNPSPFSARSGVPFGRPGNRFWPAALRAGLVRRERDPFAALHAGLGFTDLCKRVTRRASELSAEEYRRGIERLARKLRELRPGALCFVGLDGWRRAVDRRAGPGWLTGGFSGRPAYLMPSTSGLNARADLDALARHLEIVRRAAEPGPSRSASGCQSRD